MANLQELLLRVDDCGAARGEFAQLGFAVDESGAIVQVGSVRIRLEKCGAHDEPAISEWTFSGDHDELLRLDPVAAPPTYLRRDKPAEILVTHANRVNEIDHLVMMVPALEPTIAGLEGYAGLTCRRRAEFHGRLMAFLTAGPPTIELVEMRSRELPLIWGLALRVDDLDQTVGAIMRRGGQVSKPKPAVQGGRIIAAKTSVIPISMAFIEPPGQRTMR